MANLPPDLDPKRPLVIADLMDDSNYFPIPDDTLQLQVDTLNVLEDRVAIETFPPERQELIKNYYRYSADRQNRRSPWHAFAKMTRDTLDLI